MVTFRPSQPQCPACLRSVGTHNLRRHSTKKNPLHLWWVHARPSHSFCLPYGTSQTCCYSSRHASSIAPYKRRNPAQKKCSFCISHRTSSQCVYLTSPLVLKMWVWKASFRGPKKLTSMVLVTDCSFFEHGVPAQPLLIPSQRSRGGSRKSPRDGLSLKGPANLTNSHFQKHPGFRPLLFQKGHF